MSVAPPILDALTHDPGCRCRREPTLRVHAYVDGDGERHAVKCFDSEQEAQDVAAREAAIGAALALHADDGPPVILRASERHTSALVYPWRHGDLRRARLAARDPARFARVAELARLIARLHRAGETHGDLRPDNVLVGPGLVLADPALPGERSDAYRPPGRGVGAAGVDRFALGLTALEVLGAAVPAAGGVEAVHAALAGDQTSPPRRLPPEVRARIDEVWAGQLPRTALDAVDEALAGLLAPGSGDAGTSRLAEACDAAGDAIVGMEAAGGDDTPPGDAEVAVAPPRPRRWGRGVGLALVAILLAGGALAWGAAQVAPTLPEMVAVAGGTVMLGAGARDAGAIDEERHEVLLAPYEIATLELSQARWKAVSTVDPTRRPGCDTWLGLSLVGPDLPVACVSFYEALGVTVALSLAAGLTPAYYTDDTLRTPYTGAPGPVCWWRDADGYRLPTEAEWEHAARADRALTRFPGATDPETEACAYANVADAAHAARLKAQDGGPPPEDAFACDDGAPALAPVHSGEPAPWGLHQASGNLSEWTWDRYAPDEPDRVVRGGNFQMGRSATLVNRMGERPRTMSPTIGLRLARTPRAGWRRAEVWAGALWVRYGQPRIGAAVVAPTSRSPANHEATSVACSGWPGPTTSGVPPSQGAIVAPQDGDARSTTAGPAGTSK